MSEETQHDLALEHLSQNVKFVVIARGLIESLRGDHLVVEALCEFSILENGLLQAAHDYFAGRCLLEPSG